MSNITKGIFISDIHMPEEINLKPVFNYIKDFQPDTIILGGDIIDATGLHGVDTMPASQVDLSNYERDIKLLRNLFLALKLRAPKARYIFLEGNHEARYTRLRAKYPKTFPNTFDIPRDAFPKGVDVTWIPYGDYQSYVTFGDTIFIHGNIWPDLHSKAYALRYTPFKVVYGHLHHFQAYTTHKATLDMSPRYALTAGCLCKLSPEWKKGEAHQWTNGFISFIFDGKNVIPNVHQIENGMFHVGNKIYK